MWQSCYSRSVDDRTNHLGVRRPSRPLLCWQHGFPRWQAAFSATSSVSNPAAQTIDELSDALLASRSAIAGAIKLLENYRVVRRTGRPESEWTALSLDPASQQPQNFDAAIHEEQAALFRDGLALLADAPPERQAPLAELAALSTFLASRLPVLLDEWHLHRDRLRASGELPSPGS